MPSLRAGLTLLLVLWGLWFPRTSGAQCPGVTTQLRPFATEQLTISDTPLALTAAIYRPSGVTPILAMITVEGGAVRYADIGTPTASSGHPLTNATVTICGLDSIAAFRAIRQGAADALLFVTYYRTK
jgi:hypothetical protein